MKRYCGGECAEAAWEEGHKEECSDLMGVVLKNSVFHCSQYEAMLRKKEEQVLTAERKYRGKQLEIKALRRRVTGLEEKYVVPKFLTMTDRSSVLVARLAYFICFSTLLLG